MRILGVCLSLAILFVSVTSFAYPEMVRYGYAKCVACHISPTGGGLINNYGRDVSHDILSTWGTETSAKFLHGLYSPPENIILGGDLRALELLTNTPGLPANQYIPMESDLEGAAVYGKWTADVAVGIQESQLNPPPNKGQIFSRRHYLMYSASDELSVRVGRFIPAYGINIPEHAVVIRDDLGFGEGLETYNVEAHVSGEAWDAFGTLILGRPDDFPTDREKGGSLSGGVFFADRFKIGASYYYGSNNTQVRQVYGPWGIFGITKHFFLLSEIDTQLINTLSPQALATGMANYQRLDYEFFQGIHLFVSNEYLQTDLTSSATINRTYSLGTQLLPYTHFDVQLTWQKAQSLAQAPNYYDVGYMMFHYYL